MGQSGRRCVAAEENSKIQTGGFAMMRIACIFVFATVAYCVGAPGAAAAAKGTCTSIQAQCAMQAGGHCNTRTGVWCVGAGHWGNMVCGGSHLGYQACMDRALTTQK